jgi:hypothetical protein
VCSVLISQQTAIVSPHSVNWFVFITFTVCLLRGMDWLCTCNSGEAWVLSQVRTCRIYGGQSGTGTSFSRSNWMLCQYHSASAHYILIFISLTYLPTYLLNLLTPWSKVRLEKLTGLQIVQKFPAFYGTRKFITAFTSARHLSLSWASSIQAIPPHLASWTHLHLRVAVIRIQKRRSLVIFQKAVLFRSWEDLDYNVISLTVNGVNKANVSEVCHCTQNTSGPKFQKCYWWVKVVFVSTESCRCNKRGGYLTHSWN